MNAQASCIANLSNDEVFTPPEFANRMLDTLAEAWAANNGGADLWADSTVKFLDPFTRSRISRRSARLAGMAPAGRGREPFRTQHRLWPPRRTQAHGTGTAVAFRLRKLSASNVAGIYKMILGPSPELTGRKKSVRVDFVRENGTESVRYELMDLRPLRMGKEEFEISLSSKSVPFEFSIVLSNPPKGDAAFTVKNDWAQRDPKAVKKSLDAFNLLRPSGDIKIFDLETEKYLVDARLSFPTETSQQVARRSFIDDVVTIADRFGVALKLPDKVTRDDYETIYILKQYMQNGRLELDNISVVVVKSEENRELLPQQLATGKGVFRFENVQPHSPLKLFGTDVNTGPVTVDGELEVNDLIATLQSFQEAEIGAGVKMSFKPLAPMRVSLPSGQINSNL